MTPSNNKAKRDGFMPRTSRQQSESNIYHIVLKGNNAQQLFFDESDYVFFTKELKKAASAHNAIILALCIMSNHVHMLIRFSDTQNMPLMFKSFGASYVPKYNYYHNRIGPLFNGRYYSSAVNDDEYLFMVLRYIHFNPVKAGICDSLSEYKWSSYNEYINDVGGCLSEVCDTEFINSIISREQFNELHRVDKESFINEFIMESKLKKISDDELIEFYNRINNYDVERVVEILKKAKVSQRKMQRLLGIPKRYI